jgi:hypothetical protein
MCFAPKVSSHRKDRVGMAFDEGGNLHVTLASFVPEVTSGVYRVPPGAAMAF